MLIVTGYEASEDKAYKEPLLTNPDEPPPVPVMLAEPAAVTLECSESAYTEYPKPGQPGHTGGLVSDWLLVRGGSEVVVYQRCLSTCLHMDTFVLIFDGAAWTPKFVNKVT